MDFILEELINMEIEIKIKVLAKDKEKFLPKYATAGSAAVDLMANIKEPVLLPPGERCNIPSGIALSLPEGYAAFVFARSGLGIKKGIGLPNGVGVIDSDYRGEIFVGLINYSEEPYEIRPFDKVAQLLVLELPKVNFLPCDELDETTRGTGGFGSTGR